MLTLTLYKTTAKDADGVVREVWWSSTPADAENDRLELAKDADLIDINTCPELIPATAAGLATWFNEHDVGVN